MCHPSVHEYTERAITDAMVRGKRVLEAGSFDVNGSPRPHVEQFEPEVYLGIDIREGPRVDRVLDAVDLPADLEPFDLVISMEMLEHVQDWHGAFLGMINSLKDGGDLVLTTRGPGFPLHDYPWDCWRYTVDQMRDILESANLEVLECIPDWHPGHPGVFAHAVKPEGHKLPENLEARWAGIELSKP